MRPDSFHMKHAHTLANPLRHFATTSGLAWNHFCPVWERSCDESLPEASRLAAPWPHVSSNTPKTHTHFPGFDSDLATRQNSLSAPTYTHTQVKFADYLTGFVWDLAIFPRPNPRLPKIIKIAPITLTISQMYVCREFLVHVYACVWVDPSGLFPRARSHGGTNAPSFLFPTSHRTKWSSHWPFCKQVKKKK